MPRLYFPAVDSDFLDFDGMTTVYGVGDASDGNLTARLQLVLGEYTVDGRFLGYHSVEHGRIQLCPDTARRLDAAYDIGVDYRQQVTR